MPESWHQFCLGKLQLHSVLLEAESSLWLVASRTVAGVSFLRRPGWAGCLLHSLAGRWHGQCGTAVLLL